MSSSEPNRPPALRGAPLAVACVWVAAVTLAYLVVKELGVALVP